MTSEPATARPPAGRQSKLSTHTGLAMVVVMTGPHHRCRHHDRRPGHAVGWSPGAVLGIVVGGLIVTYVSWRWIFWINVPIGAGALLLATKVLHDRGARARRHLDLVGMVTLGLGLFGVLWAMTTLATSSFDASVAGYLVGGVVLLSAFVVVELHQAEPMLELPGAAAFLPQSDRDERALFGTTLWPSGLRPHGRRQVGAWWAQEQSHAHLERLATVS